MDNKSHDLLHFASFCRAATGEAETVFGEDSVTEVESVRDAGEASWQYKPTEADGSVELTQDFDADDPLAWVAVFVRQAAVDFVHEVLRRFAEIRSFEISGGNVGEADSTLAIEPTKQLDLTQAERTFSVEEDFYSPVMVDCQDAHALLQPNQGFVAPHWTGCKGRVVGGGFDTACGGSSVGHEALGFHPGS